MWEATGGLERPAAGALAEAGLPVVVVHPRPARDFANATGRLAKPDPLDAQGPAHVAEVVRPTPRPLPANVSLGTAPIHLRLTPGGRFKPHGGCCLPITLSPKRSHRQLDHLIAMLDACKSEQQPLELVFPRNGPFDTHP